MAFLRSAALVALLASSVNAFAPAQTEARRPTALSASKAGTSFVAAAYLLANIVTTAPVFAIDDSFAGSSQVIAGRSGGRAGGRSSSSSYKAAPTSSTRVIKHTTIIDRTAAPNVIMAPAAPVMAPPMGYGAPMGGGGDGGLGLAVGLSVVNSIGEGMREARQENEIRESRKQLTEARIKEAELEARLRSLEMAQQQPSPQPQPAN